jgi:hypothetical protein
VNGLWIPVSPAGQAATQDAGYRRQLLNAARSFAYFLRYWRFRDPATGRVLNLGESLWPGQSAFIEAAAANERIYALKARKIGYTTIECAYDAWCARFRDPNGRVHLFSRRDDAAVDLLQAVRFGLERLPEWMRLPFGQDNEHVLELVADTEDLRVIQAYPSDKNTAVEQSCTHAHVDEWWRMGDPERVWQAIEPSLMRSCHILTTGLGPVGYPAEFWRRSISGQSRYLAFFQGAFARPDRDQRWLEQKRGDMTELQIRREYPLRWEDALAAGAEFVFDPEDLDFAGEDASGRQKAVPGHTYVKAWDIGRHTDAAAGVVLDCTEEVHDVVWFERWQNVTYPTLQMLIEKVHASYPGPTVIEDNAAGEAVRENLSIRPRELIGFKTTGQTKPRIINQLQLSFQNQLLRYVATEFPQLDTELRSYQWDDRALTQDSVMALAIALEHAPLALSRRKPRGRIGRIITF